MVLLYKIYTYECSVFEARFEALRRFDELHVVFVFMEGQLGRRVLPSTSQGFLYSHIDLDGSFVFVRQPETKILLVFRQTRSVDLVNLRTLAP